VDWSETASQARLDDARRVMETNLFGAWRVTAALLPLLRRSAHPRVVNVSSGAGSLGDEQFGLTRRGGAAASYGISKAALNALTSTFAAELAGSPVLVNAAGPGLTATWPGAEQDGRPPGRRGRRLGGLGRAAARRRPARRPVPRRRAAGLVSPRRQRGVSAASAGSSS